MPVPSLTVTGINIVVVVLNVNSFQFNFELRWMMVAWPKAHPNDHHLETKCSHRLNLKMALVAKIHFLALCTCLLEIGHDSWVRRKIENAKVQTFLPFTGSAHLTFSHAPIMQFFERTTSSTPEWTRNHQKTQPFYPKTSWGLKTMSYNWLAERSSNFKGDAGGNNWPKMKPSK